MLGPTVLCTAGSATQIGVLVVPFCVVLAWIMGRPLDLNFNEFEGLVLFVSVLLTALMVQVRTDSCEVVHAAYKWHSKVQLGLPNLSMLAVVESRIPVFQETVC